MLANFDENQKMKVHLIRHKDLGKTRFNNILTSLNFKKNKKKTNPINFLGHCTDPSIDMDIIDHENEEYQSMIKRTQDEQSVDPLYPDDFNHYFNVCNEIRQRDGIVKDDICILLTNELNSNNFFGWCDDDLKNIFIQTSQWELIFGNECQYDFAVMYEINAWILRSLAFENRNQMRLSIGRKNEGLVMDLCRSKEEIATKMKTADISSKLLNQLSEINKEKYLELSFIINQFERIRFGVISRDNSKILSTPVTLRFTNDNHDKHFIVVEEFGNMDLGLELSLRVIYRLLLQHEKGIHYDNMSEHKQEIYNLYYIENANKRLTLTLLTTIKNVFDISYSQEERDEYSIVLDEDNSELEFNDNLELNYTVENTKKLFNENVSKINEILKEKIPPKVVQDYLIVSKNNVYSINLDRSLVEYD